jgi:hypothetical protein
MLVNTVTLANTQKIQLIDEFFTVEPMLALTRICDDFAQHNTRWTQPEGFNRSRWVYDCKSTEFELVTEYLTSPALLHQLSELTGSQVRLTNTAMWVDSAGIGQLRPHRETATGFLAQVFVTRQTDNLNGTTFYNDGRQVLFQLPYRNNFGWLFEGDRVLHGRQADVTPGLNRFSVMMWYARTQ